MIYLFVVILHIVTASGGELAQAEGQFHWSSAQYSTIAECESRRASVIEHAMTQETTILVSQCAAAQDIVQYKGYSKPSSTKAEGKPNA